MMSRSLLFSALLILFIHTRLFAADINCRSARDLVQKTALSTDTPELKAEKYREATQLCPTMPEAHFNLALELLKQNNPAEAVTSLQRTLDLKEDLSARIALGNALVLLSRLDDAETQYRKVLERDKKNEKALQGLAVTLERQGKLEDALATTAEALALNPNDALSSRNYGALQEKLGKNAEAVTSYERALKSDPNNVELMKTLAHNYELSGRLTESERMLERAAQINPRDASLQRGIARLHQRRGDLAKAEIALRRAVDLEPKDSATAVALANVLIDEKREQQAIEILREVLAQEKPPVSARALHARALIEMGQLKEALTEIDRAIAEDALDGALRNTRGIIFARTNRSTEARQEFEAAIKLTPELDSARRNLAELERR